jgi:hypothetical protein
MKREIDGFELKLNFNILSFIISWVIYKETILILKLSLKIFYILKLFFKSL